MIDIANEQVLIRYLSDMKIIGCGEKVNIHYFGGGVSGTVAMVCSQNKSLLVKQALSSLKVAETWECDPRRIFVEDRALKVYKEIVPDCVPSPIFFDDTNYIMIREAVSESWVMWKKQLLEGVLDYRVAEKTIRTLCKIHNETSKSEQMREMFYDSQFFYGLRIEPYIEAVVKKYPQLKEKADAVIDFLLNQKVSLVHGDFSPKNILVKEGEICILDLEVAHFGNPCFDLAFFSNHFFLKAIKFKEKGKGYLSILDYMLRIYFDGVCCMSRTELEEQSVRTLAFLLLARVDGKSPVEYLTEPADKELVRKLSFKMIEENVTTYSQTAMLLLNLLQITD